MLFSFESLDYCQNFLGRSPQTWVRSHQLFLKFLRIAQFFIHSVFHSDDVINAFIQKVFMLNVATTPLKEKNTHFSLWSSKFSTRALKSNES